MWRPTHGGAPEQQLQAAAAQGSSLWPPGPILFGRCSVVVAAAVMVAPAVMVVVAVDACSQMCWHSVQAYTSMKPLSSHRAIEPYQSY